MLHLGLLAGALAAVLWSAGASPARAETPRPDQPVHPAASPPARFERFGYLTRDPARFQSARLRAYASTASEPCLTYTYGVNGLSSTGTMTYSWAEEVGWCYNGRQVTFASVVYKPRTSFAWTFLGISSRTERWASDSSFFQARSVGMFGFSCVSSSGGCATYRYPYVSVVVYGNGAYSGSGSAND